ncbi:MAG: hypothetical protein IPJ14_14890 [Kineosporiaceae bacterium]|nr:hypothetical protein [Kineosporiaceae bacterium]MBK7623904.1 hypothetical protein [Kineosporiaceae bacterium]
MTDWSLLGLRGNPAPGDPVALRAAAGRLTTIAETLGGLARRLDAARPTLDGPTMVGDYASQYRAAFSELAPELRKVEQGHRRCGQALQTYADTLSATQTAIGPVARRADQAQGTYLGQLTRIRTLVSATRFVDLSSPERVTRGAVERQIVGMNEANRQQVLVAATRAERATADRKAAARDALRIANERQVAVERAVREINEAHDSLGLSSSQVRRWLGEVMARLGVLPDVTLGLLALPLFGIGSALQAGGIFTTWATKLRYGTFAPRVNGRFTAIGVSRWRDALRMASNKNWRALRSQGARVKGLSRLSTGMTVAGGVVAFAGGAWSEWEDTADDPTLSTSERVGRSAAQGSFSAAGAVAGGMAGAKGGAVIGGLIGGPPGALVGGVVGGVVGGAIGGWGADALTQTAAGEAVKNKVGEATEKFSDLASSAGSAVSDRLSFWKHW